MNSSDNNFCHVGWAISFLLILWGLNILVDRVKKLEPQCLAAEQKGEK